MNTPYLFSLFASLMLVVSSCHQTQWNSVNSSNSEASAPESIQTLFARYPDQVMRLTAKSPGNTYQYDIGEYDSVYSRENGEWRFTKIEMVLHERMPAGKILVDFAALDEHGNRVEMKHVDLLRLIPRIDSKGDLQHGELLLEEFNRFGVEFRKEHQEFKVIPAKGSPLASDRLYRARIVNNCLAASKWELELISADFGDFEQRLGDSKNLNQNRILAHSWFYLDPQLYDALLRLKNPELAIDPTLPYDSLSAKAERTKVDWSTLRPSLRHTINTVTLEVGHQSGRLIEPVDVEQFYKRDFGLHLNRKEGATYASILKEPIQLTRFVNEGFYYDTIVAHFDVNWMQYMDSVRVDEIDLKGIESYVQITLTGKWCPYEITIGNIDLALIQEQKLMGLLFGMNTYPKTRRYNPFQSTIVFDPEMIPEAQKPYLLMTDTKTGNWVNNQYKGIEKAYLSYESLEHDVLLIYLLSYERITPVWMARIELPTTTREAVRVRRQLYNY